MDAHDYHPETGEYLQTRSTREDPKEPGRYLIPANATTVAPPAALQGKVRVWSGTEWQQIADHRGETWWRDHETSVEIETLGDPATFDPPLLDTQPAPPPLTVEDLRRHAASARWQREVAGTTLDLGGGVIVPVPTDREGRSALKQARDMLRDGELLDASDNVRTTADVVIGAFAASLDDAGMTAILKAAAQHVQAQFAIQKTVLAQINAGQITTTSEIDAAFSI